LSSTKSYSSTTSLKLNLHAKTCIVQPAVASQCLIARETIQFSERMCGRRFMSEIESCAFASVMWWGSSPRCLVLCHACEKQQQEHVLFICNCCLPAAEASQAFDFPCHRNPSGISKPTFLS
jgi:hypothetical protein